MKGDFSRYSFIKNRHYSNVLMQQGRVQLDADWNEFQAIYDHHEQTACNDIIGKCGVPTDGGGFEIGFTPEGKDLTISSGRIYVDGILCELDIGSSVQASVTKNSEGNNLVNITVADWIVDGKEFEVGQWIQLSAIGSKTAAAKLFKVVDAKKDLKNLTLNDNVSMFEEAPSLEVRRIPSYLFQEDYYPDPLPSTSDKEGYYFVYLDVWKRHMTALEDPHIKEVAIGGPDTTTRIQTICQVKLSKWDPEVSRKATLPNCNDLSIIPASTGMMNARTAPPSKPTNLCQIPPGTGYQRSENQLYRVEIHNAGQLGGKASGTNRAPTFKWARDNASFVTAIEFVTGQDIIVADLGKECFKKGQWVEISTDITELAGEPGQLVQITEQLSSNITVKPAPATRVRYDQALHPKLRCWDTGESGSEVIAASTEWIELNTSEGIQVQFSPGSYSTGDYWLVPARTAIRELEWPPFEVPNNNPQPEPPMGIKHHYCTLAIVQYSKDAWTFIKDCRNVFPPLTCRSAMHIIKTSWRNDGFLSIQGLLQNGLQIDLDSAPDANSVVNDNTMMVAMEVVIQQPSTNQTQILPGIATVSANSIRWNYLQTPQNRSVSNTPSVMGQISTAAGGIPITLRVLLKGRFIWGAQGGRRIYLDGQALGKPGTNFDKSSRIDLDLPSGDCRKASDFESWVRLVANTLPLKITAVDFFEVGGKSIGHFSPPTASTPHILTKGIMNAIAITFSRPIKPESLGTIDSQSVMLSVVSRQTPTPTSAILIPGSIDLSPEGTVVRFSITDSTQIRKGESFRLEVLAKSIVSGAPAVVAAEDNTPLDGDSGNPGANNFDMNFRTSDT